MTGSVSRSAGVDKQVREGTDKNEFLTHLEEVDSGKMAVEVNTLTHIVQQKKF